MAQLEVASSRVSTEIYVDSPPAYEEVASQLAQEAADVRGAQSIDRAFWLV
jgi:hypothetical protein